MLKRAQEFIDGGLYVSIIFMDLSKAFDCVDHNILLDKIYKVGIRGNMWELIKSYLENRYQYVEMHEIKSDTKLFNKFSIFV